MLKKYHIGSVFQLPLVYHDCLLNFDGWCVFFPGRVVDKLYFLLCFLLNATTAPRNLQFFSKKKKWSELFIPDLLRDVFLLDCGIIFLSPKIFCVYVS